MLYKLLPLPLKVSLDYVMLVNLSARRVTKPLLNILIYWVLDKHLKNCLNYKKL